MGYLEAFRGTTNGAKHPRKVPSHVGFPRNVWGENMIRPKEAKKCQKLKVIIHAFGLS